MPPDSKLPDKTVKISTGLIGLVVLLCLAISLIGWLSWNVSGTDDSGAEETLAESSLLIESVNTSEESESDNIPVEFMLSVPFTSQAPFGDWGMPYQEACEEAAALVVHYFYQGDSFTPAIADQEIKGLVSFENDYFGDYEDTTAEQTAEFIKEYWGYDRVEVIEDPTIDDIRAQIAAGRPVIVPCAGRQLGNPNFTLPGPLYHMIVVTGYDEEEFVTNDVGTRLGEGYRYQFDTIMKAMHDWNGGSVNSGAKRIIVVYPKD